jgi:rod shape-determining protein MreD
VLLWATQVFILNHINLSVLFNPMIYPLFIMLLPFETPYWVVVLLGFLIGLSVDFFSGSFGLNASAGALIGFLRPSLLNFVAPPDGYDIGELSLSRMGLKWFLSYTIIVILIHHCYFFIIQTFSFSQFFALIARILLSSALSCLLIIIVEFLFTKRKKA